MAQVNSNDVALKMAEETSPKTASTTWHDVLYLPGTLKASPIVRKVTSNPVSKNGNPQKGATVGVDASMAFTDDARFEPLYLLGRAAFMSEYNGGLRFRPTGVTATGFTVASGGALTQDTLIVVRGTGVAANDGVHVVGAASIGTEIKTAGLSAQVLTDAMNVTLDVVGWQGATGDIEINSALNIISTTKDLTQLGISPGERIRLGGDAVGTQFATAGALLTARVLTVAANLITVDRREGTWLEDDGAGKTIHLITGVTGRARLNVDDADFLKTSITFERTLENLQNPDGTGDMYSYPVGCYLNQFKLNLATEATVKMEASFVGLDCLPPTTSRLSGASASRRVVAKQPFNCTADIGVIVIAETDETLRSTYFETLSFMIDNKISAKHVIGDEGAVFVNVGKVAVTADTKLIFTDAELQSAVRDNRTLAAWFGAGHEEGAFYVDLPKVTIEGGDEDAPVDDVVSINVKIVAHEDDTFGYCAAMTLFPYWP